MASGFYDFVAGAKPLATEWDDYISKQVVMVFATAAARDTALSSVKREGMVAYLLDAPNRITYYDGANWQILSSEWTTWSPTYGNLTVGSGTTTTQFAYTGMRQVTATWRFVLSGSSMGTAPTVTLPVAPSTSLEIEATRLTMQDASGARYYGAISSAGGSTVTLLSEQVSGSAIIAGQITATAPFTWADSDYLIFSITYGI